MVRIMPETPLNTRVVVLAYDGLCTFEFGCALEVFALPRPEFGEDWYRCAVASLEPGPLRAQGGIRVLAEGGAELLRAAGTIIIPGWRGVGEPVPAALCDTLREAHGNGARILSLCSGAFVLAAAGLLEGRRATTHWRYFPALAERHPGLTLVPDVLYVDEGSVLTAAGSAAGLDLCLHLVRRDFGAAKANAVARRLVIPPQRQGGQAQFVERPVPPARGGGSLLAPLLDRVRGSLAEEWDIARMARAAALSPRGLHRHFRATLGQSPGAWLLAERVAQARALLEAGHPVQRVTEECGFGSALAMRQQFKAAMGVTPSAYRARFSVSP